MRMLYVGTVGALFSLPFYILWFCKPPGSVVVAVIIWLLLVLFFWIYFDDEGRFCG